MRPVSTLLSAALISLLVAPAMAAPRPSSIPLPMDFQPEGIAVGAGNTFYVGSLRDGDIYRGDLRSGKGALFVDVDDRVAVGMRVDKARHWLVVAGGATGHAWVYDTTDGSTVADLVIGEPGATFTNDVAITRHALYFTETFAPRIYKVPIRADGTFGPTRPITVTGPAAAPTDGFGLNGIDSTHRRWLIVNHTALGILALVDPSTGVSKKIRLSGPALVAGTLDGLQLEGRTAWVVQNFANSVARVKLSPRLTSGRVVDVITSDLFRVPTTVARHGCTLALVNARFDLGSPPPFGPGAPPGTEFDVVQIRP
ncbi:MAG: putative superoxide dismutase (SodC), Cu-Zn family [Nocardioides sp.]|nr:putative superoxide dismutase (SodC), Cu-Zn family [Nocardioides sp.]